MSDYFTYEQRMLRAKLTICLSLLAAVLLFLAYLEFAS